MKFDKDRLGRRWIPYTIAACSAVTLYLLLSNLGGIWSGIRSVFHFVSPVFWGAVIAYVIDALVVFYQRTLFRKARRRRVARRVAIVLAIVTILLLIILFSIALIPQLIESVTGLVANLSGYAASLGNLLDSSELEIAGYSLDLSGVAEYLNSLLRNLAVTLQENIGHIINASYNVGKGLLNVVISFILAVYFLADKERLKYLCKRLMRLKLRGERYRDTVSFLRRCNHILIRFITCDLLDGLIVGVVNFIFMKICGMPYAVLISVVVGVANLIPTFGPVAGGVIGTLILLLVDRRYMLRFVVFTIILQMIDGYILKPKLYGDTLGISSLWVLVSIIVGGRMFGTAGVVLAIPFAAISDFLFRDIAAGRKSAKETDEASSDPYVLPGNKERDI